MFESRSRALAALLGLLWITHAVWLGPPSLIYSTLIFLLFPMVFIWYPNEIGASGRIWLKSTEPVPGVVVASLGWLLLLVTPLITYCAKLRMDLR